MYSEPTSGASTRKQRLCLFNFKDQEEKSKLKHLLEANNYEFCVNPANADLVILPAGANPAHAKARAPGAKIEFAQNFLAARKIGQAASGALPMARVEAEEAIVDNGDSVSVCGVTVAKRTGDVDPCLLVNPARFNGLVFDKPFMETLRLIFLGISGGQHVGLEGITATAKTTAVLYAAHLLGQPLRRLNLSATSDAGEIIGKYVPAAGQDPIDFGGLSPDDPALSPGTAAILARAREADRALTATEKRLILAIEGIAPATWTFVEGALPRCLRDGAWLLIDEVNIAESSVIERLNPALEFPATLELTEHDGTRFGSGPGSIPVHPGFKTLASMNPSHYSGRGTLSPAFKRRFGVWMHVAAGGQTEAHQYLRALAYGIQPEVTVAGKSYRGPHCPATMPELAMLPNAESLLAAIANFHHSIAVAAADMGKGLGRHRREPYNFTRDSLRNLCTHITRGIRDGREPGMALVREAIEIYYLAQLDSQADKGAVKGFLRASALI